jgi:hypothetical protein
MGGGGFMEMGGGMGGGLGGGMFGAPTTPIATPAPPSTVQKGGGEGLQAILDALLRQERYVEASACKAHIASIADLSVQQKAYERAKEDDDLGVAINLKKNVFPKLKARVQPDHIVAGWSQPSSPTHLTLHQIGAKATAALGPADAAPFLTRCCSQNLQALAATSVEDAAKLHAVARSTLQLLLELPTAEQTTKLKQLDELITALLTQLRAAAESLQAAPQGDPQLSLPKVVDLLKALVQLRKLGGRLVAARTFLGAVFAASAARAAAGSAPAANCRAEMVRLVRVSLSAAGRPVDQAEEADEEVAFAEDGLTYWGAFVPIGERCALSLLPLKSRSLLPRQQTSGGSIPELPPPTVELPPTVEWGDRKLHAPAANTWAHCVRDEPPS